MKKLVVLYGFLVLVLSVFGVLMWFQVLIETSNPIQAWNIAVIFLTPVLFLMLIYTASLIIWSGYKSRKFFG